jgi:hypothetical protein
LRHQACRQAIVQASGLLRAAARRRSGRRDPSYIGNNAKACASLLFVNYIVVFSDELSAANCMAAAGASLY